MALYVVRHAKAGQRSTWTDDDELRPLSATGWAQARQIAKRLDRAKPKRLVSSPYVRCVQTLEPLAGRRQLEIVVDHRLAEGQGFAGALDLLAELPDRSVLCSHGDVIPELMMALQRRGTEFTTAPDWRKGTVWVLERTGADVVSARVWGPPKL